MALMHQRIKRISPSSTGMNTLAISKRKPSSKKKSKKTPRSKDNHLSMANLELPPLPHEMIQDQSMDGALEAVQSLLDEFTGKDIDVILSVCDPKEKEFLIKALGRGSK